MAYLTLSQVRGKAQFSDPLRENLSRKSLTSKNTVFLSHSHQDADIIRPVINFLLTLGVEVYVDWLDDSMPKTTSSETASRLKDKIRESDRFLVLLSEKSVESKWVPWELGYADGVKQIKDIAILPVRRGDSTSDSTFNGLEYMTLYPVIKEGFRDSKTYFSIFPAARVGDSKSGRNLDTHWLHRGSVYF